jgi:hypothetical protein
VAVAAALVALAALPPLSLLSPQGFVFWVCSLGVRINWGVLDWMLGVLSI